MTFDPSITPNNKKMEMVLMPADQLRTMMIEAASIAVKHNLQATPSIQTEADELLTPEETAKLLKVSKVTIWQWSKPTPGILNPRRIGNQIRYLKSEVLAAARPRKGKSVS